MVEMEPWWCKFETPLKNGRHEACFRVYTCVCVRVYAWFLADHEEYEGREGTEDEQGDRKMVARKEARA